MTAYSMQEDAGRFMRQGLDDYVGKPVKSRHLYEVLHRWLRPRPSAARAGTPSPVGGLAKTPAQVVTAPPLPLAPPPPVAPSADEPTLDEVILHQLVELGGPEFTAELYQEFEQKREICCARPPQ
jgi:DNA-binding response OmpR family regulator